jgi:hypothetical protein
VLRMAEWRGCHGWYECILPTFGFMVRWDERSFRALEPGRRPDSRYRGSQLRSSSFARPTVDREATTRRVANGGLVFDVFYPERRSKTRLLWATDMSLRWSLGLAAMPANWFLSDSMLEAPSAPGKRKSLEHMLCDLCKKREATAHVTVCTSKSDDEPVRRDLCDDCFASLNPAMETAISSAWKDGCQYCGGPPVTGGLDPHSMMSGIYKMTCKCKPCAEEYYRYLDSKMPGFGMGTMTKERLANIKKLDVPAIFAEAEEHMKKWVRGRGLR